jgi:hypothetical protein
LIGKTNGPFEIKAFYFERTVASTPSVTWCAPAAFDRRPALTDRELDELTDALAVDRLERRDAEDRPPRP